jgi:hypothetical protein
MITNSAKWSHPSGNPVVPSPWQATACQRSRKRHHLSGRTRILRTA